jgi:chromosome segregation ATPase
MDPSLTFDVPSQQIGTAEVARNLYASIAELQLDLSPWVSSKIAAVDMLNETYAKQLENLERVYYPLSESYQRLNQGSSEMLSEERAHLTEAVKDVEVLIARLEYEINALVSKVDDVEDGISRFGTQVEDLEKRADELKITLETESWLHWFVRTLTGIGTGPNITREPAADLSSRAR